MEVRGRVAGVVEIDAGDAVGGHRPDAAGSRDCAEGEGLAALDAQVRVEVLQLEPVAGLKVVDDVAPAADRAVGHQRKGKEVRAGAAPDQVSAAGAGDDIVAVVAVDAVPLPAADQRIEAGAAVEVVDAIGSFAVVAEDDVVAVASDQVVAGPASDQPVVAAIALQLVVAVVAIESVGMLQADQAVAGVRPVEGVVPAGSGLGLVELALSRRPWRRVEDEMGRRQSHAVGEVDLEVGDGIAGVVDEQAGDAATGNRPDRVRRRRRAEHQLLGPGQAGVSVEIVECDNVAGPEVPDQVAARSRQGALGVVAPVEGVRPVAAPHLVGAVVADHHVVAGLAVQPVIVAAALDPVGAAAAVEDVSAVRPDQPVIAFAGIDLIGAVAPVERVGAVAAVQLIVAGIADDVVVAAVAVQLAVAGPTDKGVGQIRAIHVEAFDVGEGRQRRDDIVSAAAHDHRAADGAHVGFPVVVAGAAIDRVGSATEVEVADQGVVAVAAVQLVRAAAAVQIVVTGAAVENVVPGPAVEDVIATQPVDGVAGRQRAITVVAAGAIVDGHETLPRAGQLRRERTGLSIEK